MPGKTTTAVVAAPEVMSAGDITSLLQQSGMLSLPSSNFRRMKMDSGLIVSLDAQGEIEAQYPPRFKGKEPLPALTVRIVKPPVYYNAIWLGPEVNDKGEPTQAFDPARIGRPELNRTFSKHYDDPADQAADASPSNDVYADIVAMTGKRGDFRADIQVQIVPDDGQMTGEETVYTFSLSASAAMDFRGTRKNPTGGVAQEKNFIVQLAELAAADKEDRAAQEKAILDAMEAFRLGGVIADVYILRCENKETNFVWNIPAFSPIHIEYPDSAPALASGDEPGF